jgi:hypothetical protein
MIRKTLERYDMSDHYGPDTDTTKEAWKKLVSEAIQRRETKQWQHCLDSDASTSPAAKWYNSVKRGWGYEKYLDMRETNEYGVESHRSAQGRRLRAQMRMWSAPLAAILHRVGRHIIKGTPPSPTCVMCNTGADETPAHVICTCPAYAGRRSSLFALAEQEWNSEVLNTNVRNSSIAWLRMNEEQKAIWLLSYDTNRDIVSAVNNFLFDVFNARSKAIKRMSKQDQHSAALLHVATLIQNQPDFSASNPL